MMSNSHWYGADLASSPDALRNCTGAAACVDAARVAQRVLRNYFTYFWFSPPNSPQRAKAAFAVDGILVGPSLVRSCWPTEAVCSVQQLRALHKVQG